MLKKSFIFYTNLIEPKSLKHLEILSLDIWKGLRGTIEAYCFGDVRTFFFQKFQIY